MSKKLMIAVLAVAIIAALIVAANVARSQTVPEYVSGELTAGMHQIFPDSTGIKGLSYMQAVEASSDLRIRLHTIRPAFGDTIQIAPKFVTADTDTAMSVPAGTQFRYQSLISIIEIVQGSGTFWGER